MTPIAGAVQFLEMAGPQNNDRFQELDRFFMGESNVHRTLHDLTKILDEEKIPYAVAGAMAVNEHGVTRATTDVDILITREGLAAFKARHLGRGYLELFPGSKGVRDTRHDVKIDFLLTGDYPGDGKPKPVAFPDPALVAERGARFSVLPMNRLIELKIVSGMAGIHRGGDYADVVRLIKAHKLTEAYGERLDPYVHDKWAEIWKAAQIEDDY